MEMKSNLILKPLSRMLPVVAAIILASVTLPSTFAHNEEQNVTLSFSTLPNGTLQANGTSLTPEEQTNLCEMPIFENMGEEVSILSQPLGSACRN